MTKKDKQIKEYAKQLLKVSMDGDDLSVERVEAVLAVLEKNPPRHYASVLKAYLKLAQREVARSTAVISYAGSVSDAAVEAIRSQLSSKYGRSIAAQTQQDDSLIAGVKVVVDCDVYDASASAALKELETSLS